MCIIDDKTLGMGSTNFSSGAFQSNYELFAFIEGPRIVGDFSAMFETDWKTRSEPPPKLNLGRKIISIFSDVIFQERHQTTGNHPHGLARRPAYNLTTSTPSSQAHTLPTMDSRQPSLNRNVITAICSSADAALLNRFSRSFSSLFCSSTEIRS